MQTLAPVHATSLQGLHVPKHSKTCPKVWGATQSRAQGCSPRLPSASCPLGTRGPFLSTDRRRVRSLRCGLRSRMLRSPHFSVPHLLTKACQVLRCKVHGSTAWRPSGSVQKWGDTEQSTPSRFSVPLALPRYLGRPYARGVVSTSLLCPPTPWPVSPAPAEGLPGGVRS